MADRWEQMSFTIPAGSTATATAAFSEPNGEVVEVVIRIPNGHAGTTTMQILYADAVVVPRSPGELITGNAESQRYSVANYPTGEGWNFAGFNAGTKAHTFRIRFGIDNIEVVGAEPLPPVILLPIET